MLLFRRNFFIGKLWYFFNSCSISFGKYIYIYMPFSKWFLQEDTAFICKAFLVKLFWERTSSLQNTSKHNTPWSVAAILLRKNLHCKLQISLEVLQHCFWETHAFFNMPFYRETTCIFEALSGKHLLNYKWQYSLKCCSIPFGSFEKYIPFSRCLFHLGHVLLFDIKHNSFLGKSI